MTSAAREIASGVQQRSTSRAITIAAVVGILIPPIYFYWALVRESINAPFLDDYDTPLKYLLTLTHLPSFRAKLVYALTTQHNEYKLIFENAVFAVQYYFFGHHLHIPALMFLGNLFIFGAFAVIVWDCCRPSWANGRELLFLLPVPYLVFQLQYASMLDFTMSGLQNVAIICFSLLTVRLLADERSAMFGLALLSLCMSVCTSGNGVFLVPVGVVLLLQQKRYRQIVPWLATTAVLGAVYLWGYHFGVSPKAQGAGLGARFATYWLFFLSFLGSSGARFVSCTPSVLLGIVFCGLLGWSIRARAWRENPAIFYSIAFIFVTALGVAFTRSGLGVAESLASRYRIYSNLLIVFFYILGYRTLEKSGNRRAQRAFLGAALVLSVGINVVSNHAGRRFLHERKTAIMCGMAEWEGRSAGISAAGSEEMSAVTRKHLALHLFDPDDAILKQAVEAGIYTPPPFNCRINP